MRATRRSVPSSVPYYSKVTFLDPPPLGGLKHAMRLAPRVAPRVGLRGAARWAASWAALDGGPFGQEIRLNQVEFWHEHLGNLGEICLEGPRGGARVGPRVGPRGVARVGPRVGGPFREEILQNQVEVWLITFCITLILKTATTQPKLAGCPFKARTLGKPSPRRNMS